jgi:hypothetical protein
LFKQKYPDEIKSSLLFITEKVLGKNLSKFEQMSDWSDQGLVKYDEGADFKQGLRYS